MTSDNLHTRVNFLNHVLTDMDPASVAQTRGLLMLSQLLLDKDQPDFWERFDRFPFQTVQAQHAVEVLASQHDPRLLARASLDWHAPVVLEGNLFEKGDFAYPTSDHTMSLAPAYLLWNQLTVRMPKSDKVSYEHHSQKWCKFQHSCLNELEKTQSLGDLPVVWSVLGQTDVTLKEVALSLNSPHTLRWLEHFTWKTEEDVERTLLQLRASAEHWRQQKWATQEQGRVIGQWFDVFNKLLSGIESSPIKTVDLQRQLHIPSSQLPVLTVGEVILGILLHEKQVVVLDQKERSFPNESKYIATNHFLPPVENPGKNSLRSLFTNSLEAQSLSNQEKIVCVLVDAFTKDPSSSMENIRFQCEVLMECAPASLRDCVVHTILKNVSFHKKGYDRTPRNPLTFFTYNPIYDGAFNTEQVQDALVKVTTTTFGAGDKNFYLFKMIKHLAPAALKNDVEYIAQCVENAKPEDRHRLKIEVGSLIGRLEQSFPPQVKRKM